MRPISRIAIAAPIPAFGQRHTVAMPTRQRQSCRRAPSEHTETHPTPRNPTGNTRTERSNHGASSKQRPLSDSVKRLVAAAGPLSRWFDSCDEPLPRRAYDYSAAAGGLVFTAGPAPSMGRDVSWRRATVSCRRRALSRTFSLRCLSIPSGRNRLLGRRCSSWPGSPELARVWNVVYARLGRAPRTLLGVSLLGYPDQLVEIEAIVVVNPDT